MGLEVIYRKQIAICVHYQFLTLLQVDRITYRAVFDLFGTINFGPFFAVGFAGGGDFELDEGTGALSGTTIGASSSSAGLGIATPDLKLFFSRFLNDNVTALTGDSPMFSGRRV